MSDLPSLPAWAMTLQRRIRQRGIDFFILHGPGVRDLHPLGARRFGTIADCLAQVILNDRSAIVTYDRGAGIGFSDRDVENDFKTVLKAYDKLGGTNLAQVQPRDPDRALQLIETYLRYQLTGNPRFSAAVIIDYGETVAPAGEPGQLPAEDRGAIVTLRRWASEPLFLQRTVTFCVLVETTATPARSRSPFPCRMSRSASGISRGAAAVPRRSRWWTPVASRFSPRDSRASTSRACSPKPRRAAPR